MGYNGTISGYLGSGGAVTGFGGSGSANPFLGAATVNDAVTTDFIVQSTKRSNTGVDIHIAVKINGSGRLIITRDPLAGGGTLDGGAVIWPFKLMNVFLNGAPQFSQYRIVASQGAAGYQRTGPAVFYNPGSVWDNAIVSVSGYSINMEDNAGTRNTALARTAPGQVPIGGTVLSALPAWSVGDTWKISAELIAGATRVRAYQNGTLVATVDDTNVARILTGYPVIAAGNIGVNGFAEIMDFQAGLGV